MKVVLTKYLLVLSIALQFSCAKKENNVLNITTNNANSIQYAKGLSIFKSDGYSKVIISNPWPNAKQNFTYILRENKAVIPDSLSSFPVIQVPLQSIVVTSTTTIPFLEMLEIENKLVGFPHTDYISSEKTRALINKGSVKNVGQNENLNLEQLINLAPELIVTFGIDNNNPMLDNLQKSGLKVLIEADWMEQSPLGKAEWIKLYGALFGKEQQANTLFKNIVKNYNQAKEVVSDVKNKPSVLYGSMYEDVWYVAKGKSWAAQFMNDAKGYYLWATLEGSGSQPLSFEQVFDKAHNASIWITGGGYKTLAELEKSNPHYKQFAAFANKQVYTFESKLGATGGTIYYELSPSRPDLVLKDYIKIFYPELLSDYNFTFATKLQ